MAELFYEDDADLSIIAGRKVAVIGYGSQGHAHALNLHDSGVDVRVGLREGSPSRSKAEDAGLQVLPVVDAVKWADVVVILAPDQVQRHLYRDEIAPNLNPGSALVFGHGFNIRYGYIKPEPGLDVVMIAPKGPGHLVRRLYQEGIGTPALVAVHQDASGQAKTLALSYARALGSTQSWRELQSEARAYRRLPVSRRHILAVWGLAWLTLDGEPDYFNLPSIGWDLYGRTGRGYAAGRYRGRGWLYGEAEYRVDVLRSGLIGAVIKDPVQDGVVWNEYLETVLKERSDWKDLYRACREQS